MISLQKTSKKPTVYANLHKVLLMHQYIHLSIIDLLGHEIMSVASGIARFKAAGVVIKTVYGMVVDPNSISHNNMAHYKIAGEVAP